MTPVLETLRDADILVLASPVYFGDISSQMKAFFDRTYSCINPDFSCRLPERIDLLGLKRTGRD